MSKGEKDLRIKTQILQERQKIKNSKTNLFLNCISQLFQVLLLLNFGKNFEKTYSFKEKFPLKYIYPLP